MPKYSTGSGGGGGDGSACELCGAETEELRKANVAGAVLEVCADCAPHDDAKKRSGSGSGHGGGGGGGAGGSGGRNRRKEAARNTARVYDAAGGDSERWEREGTDYESDRLPYLVSGYGDVAASAREAAGLTRAELAAELDVDEADLLAVEEGRATGADVGGSVVEKLEERLDVELSAE